MRCTKRELLKDWLREMKKENKSIEADLMKATRISSSTLKKILYLDGYLPSSQTMLLVSKFTGINEEKLFPLISESEEAA